MRLTVLLCAALLFAVTAAEASDIPRNAPIFSKASCSQGLTCPANVDYSADPDYMSRLPGLADSCVSASFLIKSPPPYIEEGSSLDGENCFTTKNLPKGKLGLTMTPHCCIVPDSSGQTCQITCSLYGVR